MNAKGMIEVVSLNPEPSQIALVVAVGNVPDVKVGDTVIVAKYAGVQTTIEFNDQPTDIEIFHESYILAVVE